MLYNKLSNLPKSATHSINQVFNKILRTFVANRLRHNQGKEKKSKEFGTITQPFYKLEEAIFHCIITETERHFFVWIISLLGNRLDTLKKKLSSVNIAEQRFLCKFDI